MLKATALLGTVVVQCGAGAQGSRDVFSGTSSCRYDWLLRQPHLTATIARRHRATRSSSRSAEMTPSSRSLTNRATMCQCVRVGSRGEDFWKQLWCHRSAFTNLLWSTVGFHRAAERCIMGAVFNESLRNFSFFFFVPCVVEYMAGRDQIIAPECFSERNVEPSVGVSPRTEKQMVDFPVPSPVPGADRGSCQGFSRMEAVLSRERNRPWTFPFLREWKRHGGAAHIIDVSMPPQL